MNRLKLATLDFPLPGVHLLTLFYRLASGTAPERERCAWRVR